MSKLFAFATTIQSVLLFFFIIQNVNNLTAIPFVFYFGGTEYAFTLNIYTAFAFLAGIFVVVLIASLNVFGTGLNPQGVRTMSKYMGLASVFIMLTVGSSFYILQLGQIGLIIELFLVLIYVLHAFTLLMYDNNMEAE